MRYVIVRVSTKRWRIGIVEQKNGVPVVEFISGKHKSIEFAMEGFSNWHESEKILKKKGNKVNGMLQLL